jgi:hypothetical protein
MLDGCVFVYDRLNMDEIQTVWDVSDVYGYYIGDTVSSASATGIQAQNSDMVSLVGETSISLVTVLRRDESRSGSR